MSWPTPLGRVLVCCVGMSCALGLGVSTAWAFDATADISPSTITYYGPTDPRTTKSVEYQLHITAEDRDEQFVLKDAPAVAPTVEGDATVTPVSTETLVGDYFGSPGRDGCPPQASVYDPTDYEVSLPAESSSTISFAQQLDLRSAPDFAARFVMRFQLDVPPEMDTLFVSNPPPTLAGLAPASLALRVGVAGSGKTIGPVQALPVTPGRTLAISGSQSPGRRGDLVTIWAYAPNATKAARLKVVRVDRHGRFLYRPWRPTILGTWELYATWRGRPELVESTRSPCGGPQVEVTNSPGDGTPHAPTSAPGPITDSVTPPR